MLKVKTFSGENIILNCYDLTKIALNLEQLLKSNFFLFYLAGIYYLEAEN